MSSNPYSKARWKELESTVADLRDRLVTAHSLIAEFVEACGPIQGRYFFPDLRTKCLDELARAQTEKPEADAARKGT